MENNLDKEAYRNAALARIEDYYGRFEAFMEEHAAHFAILKQKEEDGDYDGLRYDRQNIQESIEFITLIEDHNLEDEIDNYDRWRFSADIYLQFEALMKEGREITRLSTTLAIESSKDMINVFSIFLKNGLKIRAQEGEDSEITLEKIQTLEKGLAHFQKVLMMNELKLASLDDAALNWVSA